MHIHTHHRAKRRNRPSSSRIVCRGSRSTTQKAHKRRQHIAHYPNHHLYITTMAHRRCSWLPLLWPPVLLAAAAHAFPKRFERLECARALAVDMPPCKCINSVKSFLAGKISSTADMLLPSLRSSWRLYTYVSYLCSRVHNHHVGASFDVT